MFSRSMFNVFPSIALIGGLLLTSASAHAKPNSEALNSDWNSERRASAIPRDLVIDQRGLGYLRSPHGFVPHGHTIAPMADMETRGKPSTGDGSGPVVTGLDPVDGASIGSEYTFSADITDPDGIHSVSFVITYPDGVNSQAFTPTASGNTWSIALSGFSAGTWSWHVEATDVRGRTGVTTVTSAAFFTVGDGTGPVDTGDTGGDTGAPRVRVWW